jgi:hypothetical protein
MSNQIPDTYGVLEHYINNVITKVDGPNVRVICGLKRGDAVCWLFGYVVRTDLVASNAMLITGAAEEAFACQPATVRAPAICTDSCTGKARGFTWRAFFCGRTAC